VLSVTMLGALSQYVPSRYDLPNFQAKLFFEPNQALAWLRASENVDADVITGSLSRQLLSEVIVSLQTQTDHEDFYGDRDNLQLLVNGSLETVPISESKPIIIGRSRNADLSLATYGQSAKTVSREHAQISLVNGRLTIIDLNSTNGTYISGKRLPAGTTAFIRRDDEIALGHTKIKVMF